MSRKVFGVSIMESLCDTPYDTPRYSMIGEENEGK